MSADIVYWTENVTSLVAVGIFVVAVYRALLIGRALVTRVYRSRAYWIAAIMVFAIVFNAVSYVPYLSSSLTISTITFVAPFIALLLFVDSNVSVAREMDFFHRDTLNWQRARKPLLAAVLVSTVLIIAAAISNPDLSEWWAVAIVLEFFSVLGASLVYSAFAMVAIARRTYDATMRKFVRMLAYGIVGLALFVTLWLPFDEIYPSLGDVITDFILIAAAYFFYKATMSLTPVGRVGKEAGA